MLEQLAVGLDEVLAPDVTAVGRSSERASDVVQQQQAASPSPPPPLPLPAPAFAQPDSSSLASACAHCGLPGSDGLACLERETRARVAAACEGGATRLHRPSRFPGMVAAQSFTGSPPPDADPSAPVARCRRNAMLPRCPSAIVCAELVCGSSLAAATD